MSNVIIEREKSEHFEMELLESTIGQKTQLVEILYKRGVDTMGQIRIPRIFFEEFRKTLGKLHAKMD